MALVKKTQQYHAFLPYLHFNLSFMSLQVKIVGIIFSVIYIDVPFDQDGQTKPIAFLKK